MDKIATIDATTLYEMVSRIADLAVFRKENQEEFLKKLSQVVISIIPVDSCLIYFHDREKKQLILIGSKKPHKSEIGKIILAEGEGITGWAAAHQQTVAIEKEAYKDSRFKLFKELPEDRFEGFLSVPIADDSGVVGVINLQNKQPYPFTTLQIRTVEAIVSIIASAFSRVFLEQKVSNLENKLQERKLIDRAKGVLMRVKHMDEQQAYRFLQKEAMEKRRSIGQIAEAVLLVWK